MVSLEDVAAQQRDFWNGAASQPWIADQVGRDKALQPFADLVMNRLDPAVGERVLDIGCGCGGTSLDLATRVGPRGRVVGLDISAPMLELAAARQRDAGLDHVRFVAADATDADIPDGPFGKIFSRFGVMFFADPVAAFKNIRKMAAPDATLAFICWRTIEENPWVNIARLVVLKHVAAPPPPVTAPGHVPPGQFSFADPDYVRRILTSAGFQDVALDAVDIPFNVTKSTAMPKVLDAVMNRGPATRLLKDADEDVLAAVRTDLAPAIAPYIDANGLTLDSAVWVVTARTSP